MLDIQKLTTKLNRLCEQRRRLDEDYQRQSETISHQITAMKNAITRLNVNINNGNTDVICKACDGEGQISFTDAAGGRDWDDCEDCDGTGVAMNSNKKKG